MKPNSIEDLFEMHEKLNCLEDNSKFLDKYLNSAIKEKQECQNQLMIIKTDSVKYSTEIENQIKDLRSEIGWFVRVKLQQEDFIEMKKKVYKKFEVNEKLALKRNPSQFAITQFANLDETFMALANMITIQSNELEKQQKIILSNIELMLFLKEIVIPFYEEHIL